METPLCLITVFLVLLIMAVMEGAAVSDMRILSGAPAPSYSCEGKGFYTYESFIAAANSFPAFGNTGSSNDSRMEVAAFLANVVDMSQGDNLLDNCISFFLFHSFHLIKHVRFLIGYRILLCCSIKCSALLQ